MAGRQSGLILSIWNDWFLTEFIVSGKVGKRCGSFLGLTRREKILKDAKFHKAEFWQGLNV